MAKRARRVVNLDVGDAPVTLASHLRASGDTVILFRVWSVQNTMVVSGVSGGMQNETLAVTPLAPGVSDVTCTVQMGMESLVETVTFCVAGSGMADELTITGGEAPAA
jgi:hypothetical protein